jgi:uncharacterized protein YbaP (TraB family)
MKFPGTPLRTAKIGFVFAVFAALYVARMVAHAETTPIVAKISAHPALWTVHSKTATAYLLGSVHVLPPNIDWHTPELTAAIASADTFVFEAPMDSSGQTDSQDFIREHGTLPPEVALPSLLDAQTLKDYRRVLALTHVAPESLDHTRPWLAAVILEVALVRAQNYSPDSGVDRQIFALARSEGKSVQYFETVGQQFSLLMPENPQQELTEFDTDLKQLQTESNELGPLVDAWAHGDAAEVARLVNTDLEGDPAARKALLDDRNEAWMKQLKAMLGQPHTYFITVGAGHLAGRHGVPALLREAGYSVDGP